jgi:hypothetical protein
VNSQQGPNRRSQAENLERVLTQRAITDSSVAAQLEHVWKIGGKSRTRPTRATPSIFKEILAWLAAQIHAWQLFTPSTSGLNTRADWQKANPTQGAMLVNRPAEILKKTEQDEASTSEKSKPASTGELSKAV